jgi:hypothetical protein
MTPADRQRAYRERNGARVGESPGPVPSAPCGTVSAWKRHQRKGEPSCAACRAAWATYQRERYAVRQHFPLTVSPTRGTVPDTQRGTQ